MTTKNKKVQRMILVDSDLYLVANFYAAQRGLSTHEVIEEGFREYVKKAQETIGIPPTQEYMEERYKHDSGLRHKFNEGVEHTLKFKRDFFVTLVYYASQEGLTIDLLVKKILEDEIARDQEEIGYFSTKEIQERYERGRQKVLKENELVQHGKMTGNERDEFREKNK